MQVDQKPFGQSGSYDLICQGSGGLIVCIKMDVLRNDQILLQQP